MRLRDVGVSTYGADAGRSGIGSYLSEILRCWEQQGHTRRIELLVDAREQDYWASVAPGARLLPQAPVFRKNLAGVFWHLALLPLLARRRGYRRLFLCASNRRTPWWAPCPMVGTVHDLASMHLPDKYGPLHRLYLRHLLPALIARLDRILTVSQASARDIQRFVGVGPERIVVTPLAADLERFRPGPPEQARARLLPQHPLPARYLLYVARWEHPGKGHVPLIEAWERLLERADPGWDLVLAGSPWDRHEAIVERWERSPWKQRIHRLGFVAHEHIPDLYRAAEAVVFPSLFEGFGLPLLEAMACGVPVASSSRASLPEVGGEAALFFDPLDPEQFDRALEQIVADERLRGRLRQDGLARAQTFRWSDTAERTWATLNLQEELELCRA